MENAGTKKHSHFLIYFILFILSVDACVDVTGERVRLRSKVHNLEHRIKELENK